MPFFSNLILVLAGFENFESCMCPRNVTRIIDEIVTISNTRKLLRCMNCKGIIGMWDEIPATEQKEKVEKVRPPKREWSSEELLELA